MGCSMLSRKMSIFENIFLKIGMPMTDFIRLDVMLRHPSPSSNQHQQRHEPMTLCRGFVILFSIPVASPKSETGVGQYLDTSQKNTYRQYHSSGIFLMQTFILQDWCFRSYTVLRKTLKRTTPSQHTMCFDCIALETISFISNVSLLLSGKNQCDVKLMNERFW